MELTAGTFRAELHDVVGDDRHTIGLHLGTGERGVGSLEDREVLVFHLRDGKVTEVWQYIENQYTYDQVSPSAAFHVGHWAQPSRPGVRAMAGSPPR
jgi:hypothetical protein